MLEGKKLKDFAMLTLKLGVNLQKGQGLEIICPTEKGEVAKALTECAYFLGASTVHIRWENEEIDRLNYIYQSEEYLTEVPKWLVEERNYLIEKNFCYVAIAAENPTAFSGVDEKRITRSAVAKSKALKNFSNCVMANGIRWCVVSVPTKAWAEQIFKDKDNAEELLSCAIEKTMRLDALDPFSAWQTHIATLNRHADFLNQNRFTALHFKNGIGTDLTVGLCDDHVWLSAQEKSKDGVNFIANMPTEEVFTAPHRERVEGVLKNALPLSYNGQIIDGFTIKFKKGKIVEYSADKGYETLKGLIETDKGTLRLGEVALIGKNSPIAQSGILFYNTLFDENASCHLAIGKGYPTTVKGGATLTKTQLKNKGLNDSIEHVDFMIGTFDLKVEGIKADGEKVLIFSNGEWVV